MQRVIEGAAAAVPEVGAKAPRAGMVMTHPPTGPNKTLDELLADESAGAGLPEAAVRPQAPAPGGRTIISISVALIDPNPHAPRTVYTAAMIKDRAADLRSQGQHDPIHVIPNPDAPNRWMIADGWTRVLACREYKPMDALLAEVHFDLSPAEAAWFGYQQNEGRAQHCDLDRAMFYEKMITAGELPAEIARRAGISKTLMNFYRAFPKLPQDVLNVIQEKPERFGANAAYHLLKVFEARGLRKTLALASQVAETDLTVRGLSDLAQAAIHPSGRIAPTPSKRLVFSNGYYKQVNGAIELNISVADPEKRAEFASRLEELLDTVAEKKDDTPSST